MPITETYASRKVAAGKTGTPDLYVYDQLPRFLRKQIGLSFQQWLSVFAWQDIDTIMDIEIESYEVYHSSRRMAQENCLEYLMLSDDIDGLLSMIEICVSHIGKNHIMISGGHRYSSKEEALRAVSESASELNKRFVQAGVGYQFENGRIIRVDSQYLHAEVVKDALQLLGDPAFALANEEFMTAHRHLREGNLRDCNTAALRSMETVLKVICDGRGWAYNRGDTVERLFAVVRENGLFPDYLGGYFNNLIGAMKAGSPKIRDRQGGHGAAPDDEPVPDHIAAFALHLTAANIVMLVKASRGVV